MKQLFATIVAIIIGTSMLTAQSAWDTDKSHSQVKFSVTHLMISEVTGTFKDFDATLIQPGKDDFGGSTIEATIKVASVSTDNDRRDNHLRSDDFFNAEKYPDMKFKSTSFEKTGKDVYKISGNLTIRDVTKPVVLEAKLIGTVNAFGGIRAGFKATTTINRFDFGVKWDKAIETGGLIVSRDVDITLLFEFSKQQQEGKK